MRPSLCSLGCLDHVLAKEYPKNKGFFNYRLSRARRVIENAFSILAVRWRVLMQLIQSLVEKTDRIVKATICLHNFLRQENSIGYCLTSFVDSYDEAGTTNEGQWRRLVGDNNVGTLLQGAPAVRGSRPTTSALEVRNIICQFHGRFCTKEMGPFKK